MNAPPAARVGFARSYTFTLLSGLYVAQGLPFGFFTQAMPVLMREAGFSLKAISVTSLLALPWVLKFLWGPLVDRLGTPRHWLVPLQFGAALAAALLTLADLDRGFAVVFAAILLFNVLASVQDVVTDALAVRLLDAPQRGLVNGIQVGAYRLGMVLGGGLLLYVYAKAGWAPMFLTMSALLLVCALPTLLLRIGASQPVAEAGGRGMALLGGWWRRLRAPGVLGFVFLIGAYKFGDSMAASLVGPFMKDLGLSKETIALLKGTFGSGAGLVGAALGGWVAFRFGRRAALLGCGLAQTASIAFYLAAAAGLGGMAALWTACIAEHLLGGMATVALFALMMDASDPRHAGTDYSLFACAIVIVQGLASFGGALIADAAGYVPMFATGLLLSGAGCLLLVRRLDAIGGPGRVRQLWQRAAAAGGA